MQEWKTEKLRGRNSSVELASHTTVLDDGLIYRFSVLSLQAAVFSNDAPPERHHY
jgi:hypothetical protein